MEKAITEPKTRTPEEKILIAIIQQTMEDAFELSVSTNLTMAEIQQSRNWFHTKACSIICDHLGQVPDIVTGGPPCDDFTSFGRTKGLSGDKGPLIFEFLRIVNETKAPCFVFENVPNLNRQFKGIFQKFLSAAANYGYFCKTQLLEARHFGAPTLRKRIFVVGWRSSKKFERFRFPEAQYSDEDDLPLLSSIESQKTKYKFISDVLSDLPDVKTPEAEKYLNHVGRNHREATIEHLKTVPQGQQIKQSFRYRAPWHGLSQSLLAGLDDSTKSHIHPIYHREMSVREYARIHQFPDTWNFSGTHHNGIKQVANSVPIGLSYAVMNSVIKCALEID